MEGISFRSQHNENHANRKRPTDHARGCLPILGKARVLLSARRRRCTLFTPTKKPTNYEYLDELSQQFPAFSIDSNLSVNKPSNDLLSASDSIRQDRAAGSIYGSDIAFT